ncbi:hypothetical protein AnigIFM59636_007221 [Aspergillus niger]|nr:hypothetical protein AnigIFM59636_007221 [Aspergillus niger]
MYLLTPLSDIFIADRQISVRLGQSFWSRGPSLAAKFTADDFPSLQPRPENDNEDYASWLQASMELIQILHNAHAILYSSKDRTLAMVYEGDYARYLDDFRTSATTWRSAWGNLAVSPKIKTTLLIMYEYICLYTNAFSFQAVLTRASRPHRSSTKGQQSERPFADILSKGIMASPDGTESMQQSCFTKQTEQGRSNLKSSTKRLLPQPANL